MSQAAAAAAAAFELLDSCSASVSKLPSSYTASASHLHLPSSSTSFHTTPQRSSSGLLSLASTCESSSSSSSSGLTGRHAPHNTPHKRRRTVVGKQDSQLSPFAVHITNFPYGTMAKMYQRNWYFWTQVEAENCLRSVLIRHLVTLQPMIEPDPNKYFTQLGFKRRISNTWYMPRTVSLKELEETIRSAMWRDDKFMEPTLFFDWGLQQIEFSVGGDDQHSDGEEEEEDDNDDDDDSAGVESEPTKLLDSSDSYESPFRRAVQSDECDDDVVKDEIELDENDPARSATVADGNANCSLFNERIEEEQDP